jgi:hypothetical protein
MNKTGARRKMIIARVNATICDVSRCSGHSQMPVFSVKIVFNYRSRRKPFRGKEKCPEAEFMNVQFF